MIEDKTTVIELTPMPDFVETKYIKEITNRSLSYVKAGFPVHFRGGSGTGNNFRLSWRRIWL